MSVDTHLLEKSGFALATDVRIPRMVLAVRGQDGQGKTHFALTGPDPICHLAFDVGGLEGMREKFVSGDATGTPKTIYEIRLRKPRPASKKDKGAQQAVKELAQEQQEKMADAFMGALKAGARTIIMDQESDSWELARLAEFGTDSNVQHLYAQLNSKYKELLFSVYDYPGVNLALIQKLKKRYIGRKNPKTGETEDKWEGAWEPAGFGDLRYVVQATVTCWRDGEGERQFHLEVDKCRQNALCTGMVLDGDEISWPHLGSMVFPETTVEDWK